MTSSKHVTVASTSTSTSTTAVSSHPAPQPYSKQRNDARTAAHMQAAVLSQTQTHPHSTAGPSTSVLASAPTAVSSLPARCSQTTEPSTSSAATTSTLTGVGPDYSNNNKNTNDRDNDKGREKDIDNDNRSSSSNSTEADNSEDEHTPPSERLRGPEIPLRTLREREQEFSGLMREKGLRIVDMRPDGNCLFRSLAHVVFSDAERHGLCRARIMQYLVEERDYFSQFVAEDFARYVRRKSRDGTHGNHLELQAAAELFGRRIEVYSYASTPSSIHEPWVSSGSRNNAVHGANTNQAAAAYASYFTDPYHLHDHHHEDHHPDDHHHPYQHALLFDELDDEPIRLSFHRGCHYNAIVPIVPNAKTAPGQRAVKAASTSAASATSCASASGSSSSATGAGPGTGMHTSPYNSNFSNIAGSSSSGEVAARTSDAEAWSAATEEEVERAVMALSLVEATRGGASSGSGSSGAEAGDSSMMIPSSVLALVNSGYSEEVATEAYRVAGRAGLAGMVRYLTAVAAPVPNSAHARLVRNTATAAINTADTTAGVTMNTNPNMNSNTSSNAGSARVDLGVTQGHAGTGVSATGSGGGTGGGGGGNGLQGGSSSVRRAGHRPHNHGHNHTINNNQQNHSSSNPFNNNSNTSSGQQRSGRSVASLKSAGVTGTGSTRSGVVSSPSTSPSSSSSSFSIDDGDDVTGASSG